MKSLLLTEDEDSQTLSSLGLTGTEARVYLALVKSGALNVVAIAEVSGVARPDVYRIITRLQDIGLIEKIISSPNEFRSIPIFDALSMLLQRRENEHAQLIEKTNILIKKYHLLQNNSSKEKHSQFILIPEKETLIRGRARAMDNAKEKILLMIPKRKLGSVLTMFWEPFGKAIERKVCIQIITEKIEDEIELKKLVDGLVRSAYFKVRTLPFPLPANYGIYDGKEIRLSTSSKSECAGAPELWSNNSDIILLAKDYFEMKWTAATPAN